MRNRWHEYKYYRFMRNGKDCYIQFWLKKYGETIFNSAVHKVSLNIYRIIKTKNYLSAHHIYI